MDTSSEYTFPIFISSTDYNLKDFRAELARFLTELGYKPILSSAEGFPDNSPKLEPWESCIPVLDSCFVVILVIDGKYGKSFMWPNYSSIYSNKKVSPTHGEYMFAHQKGKRTLIFIRKEVMIYYQSYRIALENASGNKEEAKKHITLPDYIDVDTLDFIHVVKTTKPIPWIKEFDDITYVKKEVQKKMLNELAEIFLIKNQHIAITVDSINKILESSSRERRLEILKNVIGTKELIETFDRVEGLEKELANTQEKLNTTKEENIAEKKKFEKKIQELNTEIAKEQEQTKKSNATPFYMEDNTIKFGNPNFFVGHGYANINPLGTGTTFFPTYGSPIDSSLISNNGIASTVTLFPDNFVHLTAEKKCDGCGKVDTNSFSINLALDGFHTCLTCTRYLCNDCWPHSLSAIYRTDKCPKCVAEEKTHSV